MDKKAGENKPTYQELAEIILEWHHRQAGDGAKWFDKMVGIARRLGDEENHNSD